MSEDKRIGKWFRIMWEGRQINVCVRAIIQHPWHGELADLYPQDDGSGPKRIVAFRLRGVQKMSDEEREAEIHRRRLCPAPFETLRPADTAGTIEAQAEARRAMAEKAIARKRSYRSCLNMPRTTA